MTKMSSSKPGGGGDAESQQTRPRTRAQPLWALSWYCHERQLCGTLPVAQSDRGRDLSPLQSASKCQCCRAQPRALPCLPATAPCKRCMALLCTPSTDNTQRYWRKKYSDSLIPCQEIRGGPMTTHSESQPRSLGICAPARSAVEVSAAKMLSQGSRLTS